MTFKKLIRLRLLQINYVALSGSFKYFSSKLRWLCWRESPLLSLPDDLNLENLVAFDMRYSSLKQFSEDVKHLKKLKFLNLSHSHSLERTPNFEGLPSLESLTLKDCRSLVEVHDSIGLLACLKSLNLQDCQSLKNLPRTISELRSLEMLNLSGCTKFEELPKEMGLMKSLGVLFLDGTAITTVPESIENLENLRSLSLRDCPLIFSPREGPHVISFLPSSLQTLDIQYCNISDGVIPNHFHLGLPLLKIMKLCGNNFTCLPTSITGLPVLNTLWLNDCRELRFVPHLQQTLQKFHAKNCPLLESIDLTDVLGESDIELSGCSNLKEVKGYYKLEPLEPNVVGKLLKTDGSFTRELFVNPHAHMLDNLTNTYAVKDLQALSERGLYSIFLPGSHIPTWIGYQSEGDTLSFNVPPLRQNSKIIGFVTCAIYAWKAFSKVCYFTPSISIINSTKNYHWSYTPYITFLSSEVEQDIMWLCYWMFENQKQGVDTFDMSWRFKYELEQTDQLNFFIDMGYGIIVKRCGAHILYQQAAAMQDRLSNELAIVSHASARHNRRFLKSQPRWLTIDNQCKIRVEEASQSLQGPDFLKWAKQLGEKVNGTPDYDYKYVGPSQTLLSTTMQSLFETWSSSGKAKLREETETTEMSNRMTSYVPQPIPRSTEPEPHDTAIEDLATEDIPIQEKDINFVEITEPPAVPKKVSTKNKAKSKTEISWPSNEITPSASRMMPSLQYGSACSSQSASAIRLTELTSKIRMGSKVLGSHVGSRPKFIQQQREELGSYMNMSLEDIQNVNGFEEIERIVLTLAQNTTNLFEKIILEDLTSYLVELKETVSINSKLAMSAEAERKSIDAKTTDLSARLMQRQEQLSSLENEFSRLSEEEAELETEIQRLISRKEEVVFQRNSVADEWEKTKQEEEKELDEWGGLEMEVREANDNWVKRKETVAQANAKWKLFKEDLKL